jgi:hypothetical protein
MVLHAIHTESSHKEIGDAAMFKLTGLHCEQNLHVRVNGRKPVLRSTARTSGWGGIVENFCSTPIGQHFHDCRSGIGEWDVAARHSQRSEIRDEVGEPLAHGIPFRQR